MWIIHIDLSFQFLTNPIIHLDFQMELAKALSAKWASRKHPYSLFASFLSTTHGPKSMEKKWQIVVIVKHM